MTPFNVSLMIDISNYLDLILSLLISFGLAFEVPVIILILVILGWVKVQNYISKLKEEIEREEKFKELQKIQREIKKKSIKS